MGATGLNFNWTGVDPNDPVSLVRAAYGDIDPEDVLFGNDTIEAMLTIQSSPTLVAASLCDMMAARSARDVDRKIGDTDIKASQKYDHWKDLADRLRALGPGDIPGGTGSGAGGVLAGGIRRSEFQAERTDTEFQPYSNAIGMDDNPGGPRSVHDGVDADTDDCF